MNEKQEKIFKEIMEKLPEDIERKIAWYETTGTLNASGTLRMSIGYDENKKSINIFPNGMIELFNYRRTSHSLLRVNEAFLANLDEAIEWLKTWRIDKNERRESIHNL